jgi:YD repeat-containing protein
MSNQSTAKIDANDKPTLLAYNETTGITEAMNCDAVLDYLEVFGASVGSGTYTPLNNAKIDGNDNATLLGWNDTTGQVEALRCDDNGNLLVIGV